MSATRRMLLVAFGMTALPVVTARGGDDLADLGRRLKGLLNDPDAARRVATAYLTDIEATDFRRAAADLGMPALLAPAGRISETSALRSWLGARIRHDFATGWVIDVAGWRLSRTEVGACLLVAALV